VNPELWRVADAHVTREYEKQRGVLMVMERAFASAVETIVAAKVQVDGAPPLTGEAGDALALADFLLARTAEQLGPVEPQLPAGQEQLDLAAA
jgi:hypothetical protein